MKGTLRLARPEDNEELIELFSHVPMAGDLVLATVREPSFFALYDMQGVDRETWVYEEDGQIEATGTILVRDGWLQGEPVRVGYLGDLRARFTGMRTRGLPKVYAEIFDNARASTGCDVFLSSIMASNRMAINSLVRRRPNRESQPRYTLFRKFAAMSVHFTRKRKPKRSGYTVRTAQAKDIPQLAEFLAADHRQRPFGFRYDKGELQQRLEHWPGYSLDRTFVAEAGDEVVGVTSAWDPHAVKQFRVEAYRGSMVWVRRSFNTAATLLRWPKLPPQGDVLRYFYLVNTSVRDDDPEIFRALLDAVYAHGYGGGYHFFSLCQYEGDPLAPALKGFMTRQLDFHLYAVTDPTDPRTNFGPGRSGFEMALA